MFSDNQSHIAASREKAIYRYVTALDQGNIEDVVRVLEDAQNDPELDRIIMEINLAIEEEAQLTPLARDAQLIRELIQKHFTSSVLSEDTEELNLTVSEVAARMQADKSVPLSDREINKKLLGVHLELPEWLSVSEIKHLAGKLQVQASNRFWRIFRDTAIMMGMGRGQARMAAARRSRKSRTSKPVAKRLKNDATESRGQDDRDS